MDWLQNRNIITKTRMLAISFALLGLAAFGLSRVGWEQLYRAVPFVPAKAAPAPTTDTSRTTVALEEISELALAIEKELAQIIEPTPTVPTPQSSVAGAAQPTPLSCADQKKAHKLNHQAAIQAENNRYKHNKDKIADAYSARGMAFSSSQKKAQKAETERHEKAIKELGITYQKELKKLNC